MTPLCRMLLPLMSNKIDRLIDFDTFNNIEVFVLEFQ
jgi:hypothetical protein